MKAISLWQPWASLVAIEVKPYETRHWAPPKELIGQTIAIHAAKYADKDAKRMAEDLIYGQHPAGGHELGDKLARSMEGIADRDMGLFSRACFPVGCIICTARLDAAFELGEAAEGTAFPAASTLRAMRSRPMPGCFTVRYDDWGNYAPGRWAWLLRDVKLLKPIVPMKGRQGFFDLPQGWLVNA